MRQVPTQDATPPPVGIVGDGRVARHAHHYLTQLGHAVCTWSRRHATPAPPEALAVCRTVMLLISDAAIEPFIAAWPELREKRLVHCSGSLVTPVAEGAHPLMTFGPALYTLEEYRAIPFVLDEGGTPFDELLPGVPNPSFTIPVSARPYYHALCVMAGNFSSLLWIKLFDELQYRYGIPPAAAHPYLARTTANVMASGAEALTGPLVRGDIDTIARNLQALEGDPFQTVYDAFVRMYDQRA